VDSGIIRICFFNQGSQGANRAAYAIPQSQSRRAAVQILKIAAIEPLIGATILLTSTAGESATMLPIFRS
jgi:hypothetical protein